MQKEKIQREENLSEIHKGMDAKHEHIHEEKIEGLEFLIRSHTAGARAEREIDE